MNRTRLVTVPVPNPLANPDGHGPANAPAVEPREAADNAAAANFDFRPGEQIHCEVCRIGAGQHPVIILDGVLSDPSSVRHFATNHADFHDEDVRRSNFPGVRSRAPESYTATLMAVAEALIRAVWKLEGSVLLAPECIISLIAQPRNQLRQSQKIPHYDIAGFNVIAGVHYFFESGFGGTAFYRHRATGLECIEPADEPLYKAELAKIGADSLAGGYPHESDALFEKIFEVPAANNRLILFSGHHIHSAAIRAADRLSSEPGSGRLTVTSFIAVKR